MVLRHLNNLLHNPYLSFWAFAGFILALGVTLAFPFLWLLGFAASLMQLLLPLLLILLKEIPLGYGLIWGCGMPLGIIVSLTLMPDKAVGHSFNGVIPIALVCSGFLLCSGLLHMLVSSTGWHFHDTDQRRVQRILVTLHEYDHTNRAQLILFLSWLADATDLTPLSAFLTDPDPAVREATTLTLMKVLDNHDAQLIAQEPSTAINATDLYVTPPKDRAFILMAGVSDDEERIAQYALDCLAHLGRAAVPGIIEYFYAIGCDPMEESDVRLLLNAMRVFTSIQDTNLQPLLRELAGAANSNVRSAAANALNQWWDPAQPHELSP